MEGRRDAHAGRDSRSHEEEPSTWGTPFRMKTESERKAAVAKYGDWLRWQPQLVARIPERTGRGLLCHRGEAQACHADNIQELRNEVCCPVEVPDPPKK